jgi:16S rRNA (cytosine1407-C5)-methyltransferase
MLPALILNPQPGEKVLDLCAAPGSKTTQLAALMQNQGEIVANDTSKARLHKLRSQLEQYGMSNTRIISQPGQSLWQKYPDYFDKTLVDVPCSMEGRFRTDDPVSYSHWSEKKVKLLAKLQKWLLRSAISATKPGGVIVYSTCTLSPEENEGVIDWILKKDGHKVMIEDILPPSIPRYPTILDWRGKEYHPDVAKTVRVLPGSDWEGFYVARMRKKL